jgi:hypothetical protein
MRVAWCLRAHRPTLESSSSQKPGGGARNCAAQHSLTQARQRQMVINIAQTRPRHAPSLDMSGRTARPSTSDVRLPAAIVAAGVLIAQFDELRRKGLRIEGGALSKG